jgi:chaperonin cofactor prefoldin
MSEPSAADRPVPSIYDLILEANDSRAESAFQSVLHHESQPLQKYLNTDDQRQLSALEKELNTRFCDDYWDMCNEERKLLSKRCEKLREEIYRAVPASAILDNGRQLFHEICKVRGFGIKSRIRLERALSNLKVRAGVAQTPKQRVIEKIAHVERELRELKKMVGEMNE